MFRAEEILARLRVQPFRPLRIIANEGLRFDIPHPDLVMVTERYLAIGHPAPGGSGVFDRITHLAIVHIVGIEFFPDELIGTNGSAG